MGSWDVVDADGHVFEPEAAWETYLAPAYRERRPRIVRDNRGTTRYMIEGRLAPPGEGRGAWVPEGFVEASLRREGGVDPRARLADMDAESIQVAVLYGTLSLGFWSVVDAGFGVVLCRAFNDWLADYCAVAPERLKGTPALPLQALPEALAEARRAVVELGMVALPLPVSVMGQNPDHPSVFPLYELAQELDVPVAFHAGGGRFAAERFVDSYATAHAFVFPVDVLFGLATVLCGGVLERFPRLRVGFLEGGCGLVPSFLERLDEHFAKRPREMPQCRRRPSEYFAERCFVSCDPEERALAWVTREIGPGNVVFASDYPHWDALFPGSVAAIAARQDLGDDVKRAVLGGNARRFLPLG